MWAFLSEKAPVLVLGCRKDDAFFVTLQRRWGTPLPRVGSMEELNDYLRQCCLNDRARPATTAGINASKRILLSANSEADEHAPDGAHEHSSVTNS
ncbi:MAG: hypothetical protein R3C49_22595 [Planctomycetaceae bacterium]